MPPPPARVMQYASAGVAGGLASATAGGLASGNSGHYSIYTCDDAPKNNCFKYQAWICQVDLATIAARLETAAEHAGFADAMLTADITFEEARGPSCRASPTRTRRSGDGHGRCWPARRRTS